MIRCVRLWTGRDRKLRFEEGFIELESGAIGDSFSKALAVTSVAFHETERDPTLGWHPDTARQFVIILGGIIELETPDGSFILREGDVLFTEDTSGAGHNWEMLGSQPWQRLYAALEPGIEVPFQPVTR
jgi:quercetin dioxygenase-like cupin family protein